MLGKYLSFDGIEFPNPITPTMSSKTIENVATSEAGSDLVSIIRNSKKTWSFNFNLSSAKRDIIKALCTNELTTMVYMGSSYTVRIRDYQEQLIEGSEWVSTSEGLYQVSVKVTEY